MRTHPAAQLFPMMSDDDFSRLKEDIRENGLREPISVDSSGRIIDGRNRWRACKDLGIKPETWTWPGDESAVAFVCSMNLHRRHLTSSQRAVVALDMLPLLEREAKKRMVAGAKGRQKIAYPEAGKASEKAAELVNTNRQYVSDAKAIQKNAPELIDDVRTGKKTITEAKRELKDKDRESERKKNRRKVASAPDPKKLTGVYTTIVIDPPWDFREEGDGDVYGRTRPRYAQMSDEKIQELPVGSLAAKNAHLYLWITNRSLLTGKGWSLCEAWGFRPVTIITWCKPSIGVGNYFRNNTEHVIFGVKGSLPINRKNVGTWFEAKRGPKGHSSKPEEFLEKVESWSPGPYIEMFSRSQRRGWVSWGEDS